MLLRPLFLSCLFTLLLSSFPLFADDGSLGDQNHESAPACYSIGHPEEVGKVLTFMEPENILSTIAHLSEDYPNRSAIEETGRDAVASIKEKFEDMAKQYGRKDVKTYFVKTGSFMAPSLVVVVGENFDIPAVVVGAHFDTLGKEQAIFTKYDDGSSLNGNKPGADDDASGCACCLEVGRSLLSSHVALNRPVYFIFYSAEERGLLGSLCVVTDFLKKEIPVKAVLQFDMTGYRKNPVDPTICLMQDYTDPALTNFLAQLITTYVNVPVIYDTVGYEGSDYASWTRAGIPAAISAEGKFFDSNPAMHTSNDTLDKLSLEHMVNFTKLGISFVVELGLGAQ